MTKKSESEYPEEPKFIEARLPSEIILRQFVKDLFADKSARPFTYLVHDRGLDPKVIKHCGIGWDAKADAYTIPLRDERERLKNVKWWRPEWSKKLKKRGRKELWFVAGRPHMFLFPTHDLHKPNLVLVCEGEVDALTLLSNGYAAVTATGGAGKWDPTWGPLFADKDVVIVVDLDPDGRKHAKAVQENLLAHAKSVRILNWGDLL